MEAAIVHRNFPLPPSCGLGYLRAPPVIGPIRRVRETPPPPQCWHRGPTAVLAVSSHSVRTCFCISVLPSSRDGEHCCVVLALARKSIDSFPTRQSVTLVRRVQIFHSSYPSHYLSFQPGILSVSAVPFFASELRSSPPRHTSSLPRVSRLTVSTCRTLHQYAQMAQEIPNRSLKMHRKPT